jgi:flagellar basal-body rod protein FlgG
MNDALYIAATGMQSQQTHVDTIASNLANASTPGFKRSRVHFTDMVVQQAGAVDLLVGPDGSAASGRAAASAPHDVGVRLTGVSRVFDQAELKQTNAPLDVAIRGDGFLEVTLADGTAAYTRGGSLRVSVDGALVSAGGEPLKGNLVIPTNATNVTISQDGRLLATVPNQSTPVDVGQLELVRFADPGALLALGGGLYRAQEQAGSPQAGRPGEGGLGTVAQGFVEGANVNMVDEMVNLMVAQRAYEASVKVIQAADEMMGLVNGLRR